MPEAESGAGESEFASVIWDAVVDACQLFHVSRYLSRRAAGGDLLKLVILSARTLPLVGLIGCWNAFMPVQLLSAQAKH